MRDDALDSPAPRRRWPFGWLGLLALAWLAYELTHSPALASVFICLKFGLEDFHTALWLWRKDTHAPRRRSLFCLYFAFGLWQIAAVAFLMSIAYAAVTPRNPLPAALPQALRAFLGTFATTLVGFTLCTIFTTLAVILACRGGIRLWLSSAVHRARRHDFWPPTPYCFGRSNDLSVLLQTGLGLTTLVGLILLFTVGQRLFGGHLIVVLLSITAPVAIVLCREAISRKIFATSPSECWPEPWDLPQS